MELQIIKFKTNSLELPSKTISQIISRISSYYLNPQQQQFHQQNLTNNVNSANNKNLGISSSHSGISQYAPHSLNYQLKLSIKDLKQLKEDINNRISENQIQNCIVQIQKSLEQAAQHIQLQIYPRTQSFMNNHMVILHREQQRVRDHEYQEINFNLSKALKDGDYILGQQDNQQKEKKVVELHTLHQETLGIIEDQEPLEVDFDFEGFQEDLNYLLDKYLKVKIKNQSFQLKSDQNQGQNSDNRSNKFMSTNRSGAGSQMKLHRDNSNIRIRDPNQKSLSPISRNSNNTRVISYQNQNEDNQINQQFYQEFENSFDREQNNYSQGEQNYNQNQHINYNQNSQQSIDQEDNRWKYQSIDNQTNDQLDQSREIQDRGSPEQLSHVHHIQQAHRLSQQNRMNQIQQQQQQPKPLSPVIRERKSLIDEQGNSFYGEMINGIVKDGKGEIRYANDGSHYRGDFKNNLREGRGEHVLTNGDKYSGEWAGDMKHGYGKMEFVSTRTVYYGQWACGRMHGMGTMTGPNNYFYNGEWKQGQQFGKGIRKYEDKTTYEGYFENGQRQGIGKSVLKDGSIHEGAYKNDMRNGPGTLTYTDGTILRASWVNDVIQGRGELEKANGKLIIGEWKDNNLVKVIQEQ
ncbi:2-isopropylmalate synthase [Stylonychia lemnae]|uniref:2-isopropylmalate synthase n=1 Tax=Stylonychia lemnae TaxID=5949 RepID=A0A078ARH9_STYLE|nr:2-isopropylmalate synthase [Stylonychia lemnae]|eukprot:CDW84586.1 2-isopropylmalate synthase [Stylonychia lemnae]